MEREELSRWPWEGGSSQKKRGAPCARLCAGPKQGEVEGGVGVFNAFRARKYMNTEMIQREADEYVLSRIESSKEPHPVVMNTPKAKFFDRTSKLDCNTSKDHAIR